MTWCKEENESIAKWFNSGKLLTNMKGAYFENTVQGAPANPDSIQEDSPWAA